jgi:hypothetical protein
MKLWDEAPSRPAETVLAEIVESFMSLEWVPQPRFDNRMRPENQIIDNPIRHLHAMRRSNPLPLEPASAIEHLRRDGVKQNVLVGQSMLIAGDLCRIYTSTVNGAQRITMVKNWGGGGVSCLGDWMIWRSKGTMRDELFRRRGEMWGQRGKK